MHAKFDPWWFAAGTAVVVTLAISLHSRGFSNREIVAYCVIGLAVMPIVWFASWYADRLMPSRESLTWWQWFSGNSFLARAIGQAIICGISSVVMLALGEYWFGIGMGAACVVLILWARSKHRRLARRASKPERR